MKSKSVVYTLAIVALAVEAAGLGQTPDASKILAGVREALGADRLAAVQTLAIEGRSARPGPNGAVERQFEMHVKLPDKFLRRDVLMAMSNMSVYRLSGFNGPAGLISEIDQPPQFGHGGGGAGHGHGAGGRTAPAREMTPGQKEAQRVAALLASKKDYTRLALGMFAEAPAVYPLEFTYAGQAESPDGTAHVIDVTGEGGFAARLFVDTRTHLPMMLTWMDKEPLAMAADDRGGTAAHGAGGHGHGAPARDHGGMPKDLEAQTAQAEAGRRVVEYRLFYGDYRPVGGVKLPHMFQWMIDGTVSEELAVDRVRVNPKINDDRFRVSK